MLRRIAPLAVLLLVSCRTLDRHLVENAAASRIYYQCRYELLCVQDVSKWKCPVTPPPVRPTPVPGQCSTLFTAEEELRWETQVAEESRVSSGRLPSESRKALKAAKKRLDGLH